MSTTDNSLEGAAPFYTMYLDQSAHLDWDWRFTFENNFRYYNGNGPTQGGVDLILASATKKLAADEVYYYTICEIAFLRRYVEEHPADGAILAGFGDRFQALGGGMTSPDNLVCSGEGFIRNYLVGQSWLRGTLGMDAKPHCWIPDDFGQGPELPVLLAALGMASVGFMRVPGYQDGAVGSNFTKNGLDFVWTASDGSCVYAHWLTGWYNLGNKLWSDGTRNPAAIDQFLAYYNPVPTTAPETQTAKQAPASAQAPAPPHYAAARTPYMYIPIDDDFSMPIGGLAEDVHDWNNDVPGAGSGATPSNVQVVQGTFDQFMRNVIAADGASPLLARQGHNGTPYWTGYYASRPLLKILHEKAVRGLLAAEIFGLLASPRSAPAPSLLPRRFWSDVDAAWDDFVPSTHHDFVCGTATDSVYANEQLPLLRGVADKADALRSAALSALASTVATGQILVANSLGFARTGIAEIASVDVQAFQFTTQPSWEGGTLLHVGAPSLGYATGAPPAAEPQAPSLSQEGGMFVLSNEHLAATIDANGDLVSLQDLASGEEVLDSHRPANGLRFFVDGGGLYQFGNEPGLNGPGPGMTLDSSAVPSEPVETTILEGGGKASTPLRVRIRSRSTIKSRDYVREYALVAGEPFLRMSTTGAAPSGYSVMTEIPLAGVPATIDHGTGYHWTNVQPHDLYAAPVFRPTHDFLLARAAAAPNAEGALLAAVYHGGMPAWATAKGSALLGCLFRNTPANTWGAGGSDPAVHTQHYALRVPSSLGGAESGRPLQEALGFSTPLVAVLGAGSNPWPSDRGSLASLPAGSAGVLTAAKPGTYDPASLVLRIYQPTNGPQTLQVTVSSAPTAPPALLSAAEAVWQGGGSVVAEGAVASVSLTGAMATLALPGLGRSTAGLSGDRGEAVPEREAGQGA